jgi:hypothetical protein
MFDKNAQNLGGQEDLKHKLPMKSISILPKGSDYCLLNYYKEQEYMPIMWFKIAGFLDVMPCRLVDLYQSFAGTCCLHLHDRRMS